MCSGTAVFGVLPLERILIIHDVALCSGGVWSATAQGNSYQCGVCGYLVSCCSRSRTHVSAMCSDMTLWVSDVLPLKRIHISATYCVWVFGVLPLKRIHIRAMCSGMWPGIELPMPIRRVRILNNCCGFIVATVAMLVVQLVESTFSKGNQHDTTQSSLTSHNWASGN